MSTEEVTKEESSVRGFVRDRLRFVEQMEAMEEFENYGKVQVNIRIHAFQAFHLEYLAERFGMSRPELALELLNNAIADAWDEAGLPSVFQDEDLKKRSHAYVEAHTK